MRPTLTLAIIAQLFVAVAHAQTQAEMTQAAGRDLDEQTLKLQQAYQALETRLSPEEKGALAKVQRSWERFRDLDCDFEGMATIGGSIHPMVVAACKAGLTSDRIQDLERQADCHEHTMGCGLR